MGEDASGLPVVSTSSLQALTWALCPIFSAKSSPIWAVLWKSSPPSLPALRVDLCRPHSHPDSLTHSLLKHLPLVLSTGSFISQMSPTSRPTQCLGTSDSCLPLFNTTLLRCLLSAKACFSNEHIQLLTESTSKHRMHCSERTQTPIPQRLIS